MLSLNETWIFGLDSAGMLHESDGDVWQDKYSKQQQQNCQAMSSTNNSTLTLTTVEKERIWNRYVGYFSTLHGVCVSTCIAIDSIH